jgi:hypothetical protein
MHLSGREVALGMKMGVFCLVIWVVGILWHVRLLLRRQRKSGKKREQGGARRLSMMQQISSHLRITMRRSLMMMTVKKMRVLVSPRHQHHLCKRAVSGHQ